jgi:hypothetical protein
MLLGEHMRVHNVFHVLSSYLLRQPYITDWGGETSTIPQELMEGEVYE